MEITDKFNYSLITLIPMTVQYITMFFFSFFQQDLSFNVAENKLMKNKI